jgi:hypothetical protein
MKNKPNSFIKRLIIWSLCVCVDYLLIPLMAWMLVVKDDLMEEEE